MIEAQRARLSEMSTPLIPITDRIMVMPLIGTVDPERAAQVLEVALEGAAQRRAAVVILDITGIKQIDTQVMQTLLQSATALRLLGAQAVLTGIRPGLAQFLVEQGKELGAWTHARDPAGDRVRARAHRGRRPQRAPLRPARIQSVPPTPRKGLVDGSVQYLRALRSLPGTPPIGPADPRIDPAYPTPALPPTDPIGRADPPDRSGGPPAWVPRTPPQRLSDPRDRSRGPFGWIGPTLLIGPGDRSRSVPRTLRGVTRTDPRVEKEEQPAYGGGTGSRGLERT